VTQKAGHVLFTGLQFEITVLNELFEGFVQTLPNRGVRVLCVGVIRDEPDFRGISDELTTNDRHTLRE